MEDRHTAERGEDSVWHESKMQLSKKLVHAEVAHGPRPGDLCLVEDTDLDQLTPSAMLRLRSDVRAGMSYPRAYEAAKETVYQ